MIVLTYKLDFKKRYKTLYKDQKVEKLYDFWHAVICLFSYFNGVLSIFLLHLGQKVDSRI